MLQRQPWKSEGNKWTPPAGKFEPAETPEQAVLREVREESGLILSAAELTAHQVAYVRGSFGDIEYHLFNVVRASRPTVTLQPEEIQAYQWLPLTEALTLPLMEDEDACIKLAFNLP